MIFLRSRLLWQAFRTIRQQQRAIACLQHENQCVELAYMRISRDLIEQFLIALDQPENQDVMRDNLAVGLSFYRDEIAVREEQIV